MIRLPIFLFKISEFYQGKWFVCHMLVMALEREVLRLPHASYGAGKASDLTTHTTLRMPKIKHDSFLGKL